ncbi:MAG: hypothetical protein M5R40_25875 [Anaerolineae bacterium]|nr:hypothetical protein [Anaerolineae bacterium]
MAARTARKVTQLEHLYHGFFMEAGRPVGTPQLIAYSPDVAVGQWKEALRLAPIAPVGDEDVSGPESNAVGLFRGKSADYIVAHAQRNWAEDGVSNPATVHYLFAPAHVAEGLVENLDALPARLDVKMPTFSTLNSALRPTTLIVPDPPKPKKRVAALTALLDACDNDARTVRGLLAAIVQAKPLAIVGCDAPLAARLDFIQGLLTLLPQPTRALVTFVTNVADSAACPAQIKFVAGDRVAAEDQVYNWREARLVTAPLRGPYSAFAIGQMQLNPVSLIKQLDGLADATRHHLQYMPLSEALETVSRRAVMDISLAEGQPIDREAVIDLLQSDPTLSGRLLTDYASYLLRITLSLDEPETADALLPLLETDRTLAVALFKQLDAAAQGGQARAAYNVLRRWLNERPIIAETLPRVFGRIALAYEQELVEAGDPAAVAALLEELAVVPFVLDQRPVRNMLHGALSAARSDERLARAMLCLAAQHLEAADFDSLLADHDLVAQLPRPVQDALAHLGPEPPLERPAGDLLVRAAESLGPAGDMVLARLAEQAVVTDRHPLVGLPVLEALRTLARSERGARFGQVIQHTILSLARSGTGASLPAPAPFLMAQTLLTLDLPADLAQLLLLFQFQLFSGERREDFRDLVGDLFQQTPIPPEQALRALRGMESAEQAIDHVALARAYQGVLTAHGWEPAIEPAASRMVDLVNKRPDLVVVVGYPFIADLVRFLAGRKNRTGVMRVIGPLFERLPENSRRRDADPAPAVAGAGRRRRHPRGGGRAAARSCPAHPQKEAARLVETFGGQRAVREREALVACIALRPIFDDRNFLLLAEEIKIAADFFGDFLLAFELNRPPTPRRLAGELDALSGSLSHEERLTLSAQALEVASYVEELGDPRYQGNEAALLANKALPRSGLDLLRWLGGHFSEGKVRQRVLDAEAPRTRLVPGQRPSSSARSTSSPGCCAASCRRFHPATRPGSPTTRCGTKSRAGGANSASTSSASFRACWRRIARRSPRISRASPRPAAAGASWARTPPTRSSMGRYRRAP